MPNGRGEFNLAFADFAIVYDKDNQPVNPPSQIEGGLRTPILPARIPVPEGISTKDPGTQLINYRNDRFRCTSAHWDKECKSGQAIARESVKGE